MADMQTDQNQQTEAQPHANGGNASENVNQINREFQEKSTLRKAHDLKIPYINLSKTPLNPDFLKLLEGDDARAGRIIPFFRVGNRLRVAVEDLDNPKTKEIVKKLTSSGFEVNVNLASTSGIDDALKIYISEQKYKKLDIVEEVKTESIQTYEKEIANLSDIPKKLEDLTAEQGLNLLNIGAMKTKSSDAHFEPEENSVHVRFRIDGVLHKVFELSHKVYKQISEQIKYQSQMKLNIYSIPQDGRYIFNFNEEKVAVRVASIPTPYGESFVCRFLPSNKKFVSLEDLGFQGIALTKLQKATNISQGMVLITGPTGSGKSTTLYAMLAMMNNPENKVITLEDPVEYYMDGVTQSQIDESKGYSFAGGLRSVLRHDPDVVMLGEIRDLETAQTAAQASLTGHVVLSTLHTNSAIETIPRLVNMGLPPFMVAPSVNTLVAQRLVRKVCKECSQLEPIPESEKKEFEKIIENLKHVNPGAVIDIPEKVPLIKGCSACSNTGYSGRLVITEVITVTSEMKNLILNNSSSIDLITAARKEGIVTMREDGFLKVAQGLTTLEEVYRVTNVSR